MTYGTHADYMQRAAEGASLRRGEVEAALRDAFARFIERREVEVIAFSKMVVADLAQALLDFPSVLKPLIASCNIAARAVERDIGIKNLNTYTPQLTHDQAIALAGYVTPFLPPYLEIPALSHIDRVMFIDKEIRAGKGRWEREVCAALNKFGRAPFKKRMFLAGGESFELDAASPEEGSIEVGIDVKRIEARRDIHKRADEIVNKAARFKSANPGAQFAAIVYYPFVDEHGNIRSRLAGTSVDAIVFANEALESVENAAQMLLSQFNYLDEAQVDTGSAVVDLE